ncbi:MAG: hypothetical protein JKY60_18580 [Kordiimonadaceae bacterium]|nr:hypothetical protein [Kordiimonadaceae bacterium]
MAKADEMPVAASCHDSAMKEAQEAQKVAEPCAHDTLVPCQYAAILQGLGGYAPKSEDFGYSAARMQSVTDYLHALEPDPPKIDAL